MAEFSIAQLKDLQDKTTLKGVYFFLSISVMTFIMSLNIEINILLDPIQSISTYLFIITTSSVLAALLYYFQLEILLFKVLLNFLLRLKGNKYPRYRNVSLPQGINHKFISNIKNKFFSKSIFSFSLLFILLSFLKELYFPFIFLLFLPILIGLIIWLYFDLKALLINTKLIYFMKLFLQQNNMINDDENMNFVKNVSNNLWDEAKMNFSYFIEQHLKKHYILYSSFIEAYDILNDFHSCCKVLYNKEISVKDYDIVDYILRNVNVGFDSIIHNSTYSSLEENFQYFFDLINDINGWDKWLKYLIFKNEDFILNFYLIKNLLAIFSKEDQDKMYHYSVNKNIAEEKRINEMKGLYLKLFNKFLQKDSFSNLEKFITEGFTKKKFILILNNLRINVNSLEKDLGINKHLNKRNKQKIFNSLNQIFIFIIQAVKENPENVQSKKNIFNFIRNLKLYEEDLILLNIECHFVHDSLYFELGKLKLNLKWDIDPNNIKGQRITKVNVNLHNISELKQLLFASLEDRREKFKLKFKNSEFWKA